MIQEDPAILFEIRIQRDSQHAFLESFETGNRRDFDSLFGVG